MARSAPALSSFTAGEISPRLEGRVNLEKYREGLSELTNMVVHPQGGVTRRPGTEFLAEVNNSANYTRLIPFQFKTSDTYILEFGNLYMRVFRNGAPVLTGTTPRTITAISKANPGVITTSGAHGYTNGTQVFLYDITTMTELNNATYVVANASSGTFTLRDRFGNDIDTTNFTTYSGTAGRVDTIYQITSPYYTSQLPTVNFAQSADVMYLVHPSVSIRTLTRTDHNAWTFSTVTITGTPSPALNGAGNTQPSVVSFFEQRLVFGGSVNNPQTLWFSKTGDYLNFTTGTGADDALVYTIASNQVNAIRFLSATRVLTIGTSGGEYVLTTTNNGPVTPTTTQIRKYSNYGTADIAPVQVADVTLFVERGARKLREFRYVGEVDVAGYQAPDLTILSEHLTEGGITEIAYQQAPDSIVWAVRADGTLLGMTYRRDEQMIAWHKHVIGGAFSGGQAVVESIATLPTDSGEDELYMVVKRTISGQTKRYIEKLSLFEFGDETTSAYFVDSGLTYSGSATTTLRGLWHLPGVEVNVLGNGASHPNRTVSAGAITTAFSVTSAAVGYGYTSRMQTLRLEAGSADGTSQGKPKRIHAITLRLYRSVGLEVGPASTDLDLVYFRDSSMPMGQAVPLFTGDKAVEFPGGFENDDRIYVRQSQPLPLTVLALYPRLNTFDL